MVKNRAPSVAAVLCAALLLTAAPPPAPLAAQSHPPGADGDDGEAILSLDHYVPVKSTVPAMDGETAQIYLRERVRAGTLLRGGVPDDRVVIFVHGAGTPGAVGFDVPYQDYSWMEYLARAGFDVFAIDFTGYGRSTRPSPMNDPCNLPAESQTAFVPGPLAAQCPPVYAHAMTTIESDWNDLGAAVDYVRRLRGVERVSFVAWSLGGPRAGGWTARNPDRVDRLVLLAPAYNRDAPGAAPATVPGPGTPFNTQSYAEFVANLERQMGCADQADPAVARVIWSEMLRSDPVGATWGPGVRRAPRTTTWGWNASVVSGLRVPTLLVAGAHDKQVAPERVRELHADLGSAEKVFIDLGCASHAAMWDRNHELLFRASLEWLTTGSVQGAREGVLRLGY
jgi:pimeloyl-ACP methyl ester carboxylesterase